MKSWFITDILGKLKSIRVKRHYRRVPRSRRRWRLEIINENTLTRTWSLRLSEMRALAVAGALTAAMVSLLLVVALFTPLGQSLRGHLPKALRSDYVELSLHVDSLHEAAALQDRYARMVLAALQSQPMGDTLAAAPAGGLPLDSLHGAGADERQFVQQFEARERFNISVLSPIAAEGMMFEPATATPHRTGAVSAVYRGTVVAAGYDDRALGHIFLQLPNDFLVQYHGLDDIYVKAGDKVLPGQRIATTATPLQLELWHRGTRLDPTLYIGSQQ